ncbi:MAG TPA: polysaccharide deacetylase [Pseudonocardia sp.]|uniref:polysaccharide deacetylase n=1 Tax=Pseudonocardia sp. TaxID=60912 RepID=UPI002B4B15D9|nr:polysaccharide deacetylase [Pseudonocardia sp.]HLU60515.1 polysaccharide deacetylase [Pseudonocardia sp.]
MGDGRRGGRRVGEWFLLAAALALVCGLLAGRELPEPEADAAALDAAPAPAADPVDVQTERAAARLAAWMRPLAPGERPPQFVLFSFDGVGSHRHWERVLALAGASEARVTGFLSGVYLLPDSERRRYRPPGRAAGRSAIGFGGSRSEVDTLIADLMEARRRGHEIGTHYNGHFCSGDEPSVGRWSTEMWNAELDQFFAFVEAARERGLDLGPGAVKGGRTPCLEGRWSQAYAAMRAHGFTYDTSRPTDGIVWPTNENGIWEFWMPSVRVPDLGRQALLMDYNLWIAVNGGRDQPERAAEISDTVLGAYRAAYTAARDGNRAPLVIGNHFNRWSGGGFFDAVERFMAEVCLQPETVCATHSDVVAWMELQDREVLDAWRAAPRARVSRTP